MRPGREAVLLGRTEVKATVVVEGVTMVLLRRARGGRVVGRRGRTGVVGESLHGAMVTRKATLRSRRSDGRVSRGY